MDRLNTSSSLSENKRQAIRERMDDDSVLGAHFRLMSDPSHYIYRGKDAIEQMFDDRIMIEEFIEKGLLPENASSFYTHISPKKLEMFKSSKLSREELLARLYEKDDISIREIILFFTLADAKELCAFNEESIDAYTSEEIQKIVRAAKKNHTGLQSEQDRSRINDIKELGKCLSLLIRNAKKYYKESIIGKVTPDDAPQKS